MDFRRTVTDDAPGIVALEEELFPDPWSLRDVMDTVCTSGAMCYTAVEGGRVIAYLLGRVIAPEGELYRIATRPSHRRRGIAYRLLDYAEKTERGRGLERLFLEVREQNTAARALYRAYGFQSIGRRPHYYRDPVEDAILMVKASPADLR